MPFNRSARPACRYLPLLLLFLWPCRPSRGQTETDDLKVIMLPPSRAVTAADRDAASEARYLWKQIVRVCPIQDSRFPSSRKSAFYLNQRLGRLFEYRDPDRDPFIALVPDDLSGADRLNGFGWSGATYLAASAYRVMEVEASQHQWSQWFDIGNSQDAIIRFLTTGNERGVVQLKMEKKNGRWAYSLVGVLGLPDDSLALGDVATNIPACAAAVSPNPYSVEEARAEARARAEEVRAESARQQQAEIASLKIYRELGNAFLCAGTKGNPSGPLQSNTMVSIVGAGDLDGRLWHQVTVWMDDPKGYNFFHVETSDLKDSCPGDNKHFPNLFSGDRLAARVRTAGSVEQFAKIYAREVSGNATIDTAPITPEEFPSRLAGALQKRAPEFDADPSKYDAAIREVAGLVKFCMGFTAQQYASTFIRSIDGPFANLYGYQHGKYLECEQSLGLVKSSPQGYRGLVYKTSLKRNWSVARNAWLAAKLHVDVLFAPSAAQPGKKWTSLGDPPIFIDPPGQGFGRFQSLDYFEREYGILSTDVK